MHQLSRRRAHARTAFLAPAACAGLVAIAALLGTASPAPAQGLPDLVVMDLTLRADCVVLATLKNQGPGPLPALAAGALRVRPYKNGSAYGDEVLEPPEVEALRPAGGTVTRAVGILVDGVADVSVTVDNSHAVEEAVETNNTFSKRLSCSASLPDLAITGIRFSPPSCAPILTIANRGNGPLPQRAYSEVYLNRIFDGEHVLGTFGSAPQITDVDPKRALQPAGGTVEWIDPTPYRAAKNIRYEFTGVYFIEKYGDADNKIETTIPSTCLPDLVADDVTTNAGCDFLASVRNAGPGPLPYKPVGADQHIEIPRPALWFSVSTGDAVKPYGGWQLRSTEAEALRLPGGTLTYRKSNVSTSNPDAPVSVHGIVKVTIDSSGALQEARTDNNTLEKLINCGPGPVSVAPRQGETTEVVRRPVPLAGRQPVAVRSAPLAIRGVAWNAACHAVLTLANTSGVTLARGLYLPSGVRLERSVGGTVQATIGLAKIDPLQKLQPPGGVLEWTDFVAASSGPVRWELKGPGFGLPIPSQRTENVPARCAARPVMRKR